MKLAGVSVSNIGDSCANVKQNFTSPALILHIISLCSGYLNTKAKNETAYMALQCLFCAAGWDNTEIFLVSCDAATGSCCAVKNG